MVHLINDSGKVIGMKTQIKIQIDSEQYEFIKKVYRDLNYRSLSEYLRVAISAQVKRDRIKLRKMARAKAMEMIGKASCDSAFESIEGDDFELSDPRSPLSACPP